MWDTIRRLVKTGSTVLLTTQYLDEADQLADRVAVIDRGRVVAEGTVDTLKSSIGTASLHLRLRSPYDPEDVSRIVNNSLGTAAIDVSPNGRVIAPLTDAERVTDVLIALRKSGIGIMEMSVQKPTLDEVFLAITGHGHMSHEEVVPS
jgi:ABC-2 type transport system ATP-binding protein